MYKKKPTLKCLSCQKQQPRDLFVFYKDGTWNQKCNECKEKPKVKKGKPFTGKTCKECGKVKDSRIDFDKNKSGVPKIKCKECCLKPIQKSIVTRVCECCNKTKSRNENFKAYSNNIYAKKCFQCLSDKKLKTKKALKVAKTEIKKTTFEEKQKELLNAIEALDKVKEQESKLKLKRVVREGLNYKGAIILKKV